MSYPTDSEIGESRGVYTPGVTGQDDGGRAMVGRQSPAAAAGVMTSTQLVDIEQAKRDVRAGRNPDGSLTSGVDVVDPETGGAKGMKAEQYSLIPTWPLAELARVYGYGAKKYSSNNWRQGYRWGLSYDALQRHINAFWAGESNDPESTFHHLAHAMFHLATLMTYDNEHLGTDDRADGVTREELGTDDRADK